MTARRSDARHSAAVRLTNTGEALQSVQDELLGAAERAGYPDASGFALRLVLEEAVSNGFRHGNKGDEGAGVLVEWDVGVARITIAVEDGGDGFDPNTVPDPTTDDRLELPSGRGLLLIRAYMTDVSFNARGNRITMVYANPGLGGG